MLEEDKMFEDESSDTKEIVEYVKKRYVPKGKHGEEEQGPQFGEMRRHFRSKWGQGKWAKNWNKAKEYLEPRKPKSGGYRQYFWSPESKEAIEKTLYKDDNIQGISQSDVCQITIPQETISRAWSDYEEAQYERLKKQMGLKEFLSIFKAKFTQHEWAFFRELEKREDVRRHKGAFDVGLCYPKEDGPPQLPEGALQKLLHITFASQGFPAQVKNFKIILSFDKTKVQERQKFDEEGFVQWLKKFKKKGIPPEMLDYLKRPSESRNIERSVPLQITFLTEAEKYMKYQIEFTGKQNNYVEMINKLCERELREDPVLYSRYRKYVVK